MTHNGNMSSSSGNTPTSIATGNVEERLMVCKRSNMQISIRSFYAVQRCSKRNFPCLFVRNFMKKFYRINIFWGFLRTSNSVHSLKMLSWSLFGWMIFIDDFKCQLNRKCDRLHWCWKQCKRFDQQINAKPKSDCERYIRFAMFALCSFTDSIRSNINNMNFNRKKFFGSVQMLPLIFAWFVCYVSQALWFTCVTWNLMMKRRVNLNITWDPISKHFLP